MDISESIKIRQIEDISIINRHISDAASSVRGIRFLEWQKTDKKIVALVNRIQGNIDKAAVASVELAQLLMK